MKFQPSYFIFSLREATMKYRTILLIAVAFLMIGAGAPPKAPPGKTPPAKPPEKPGNAIDRFGDIKPKEREALTIESRGRYEEAIAIYWECFADAVKAAQKATGEEKVLEIALQEFYVEKATCLTEDIGSRPMNIKKLEEAAEMPGVDPYVRGRVLWELLNAVLAAGDAKRARQIRDQLGFINKWAIIGPFDNERGRNFNNPFPPEKKLEIEKKEGDSVLPVTYEGKAGRKVSWRMLPVDSPMGTVDFDVLLRPDDQVLAYALAFVNSARETAAAVRITSDEGCSVWINGKRVLHRDIERRIEFDQDSAPIHLVRGWNSVLVKVGENEGDWEFRMRLTLPDGSPLPAIKPATSLKQIARLITKLPEESVSPEALVAEDAIVKFTKLVKNHPKSPWLHFRRGYLVDDRHPYDLSDRTESESINTACKLDPTVPDFWYYLGHSEIRTLREESEREYNPSRLAYLKVIELDPGYTEAYAAVASNYYLRGYNAETLKYARAAQKANPDYFYGTRLELRALASMGFDMETKLRMRELYLSGRFPYEREVIEAEIERRNEKGDLEGEAKLRRHMLSINAMDFGQRMGLVLIARIRARTPDKYPNAEKEILDEFSAVLEVEPYATGIYSMRANFYEARDRFRDALAEIDAALKITPRNMGFLVRRGDILWRLATEENDEAVRQQALDAWHFALEINPNNVELKRRLEFLEAASHFEDDPRFDEDVSPLIAAVPKDLGKENDPYAFILRKRITKVTKEGYHDDAVHEIIRILNDAGVKEFQSYSAGGGFVYTGGRHTRFTMFKITHADGTPGPAVRMGELSWIQLPLMRVGDTLEIKYRVQQARGGGFSLMENYFGDIFLLQTTVPVLNEKLVLILPPERKFYLNARNMPATPTSREVDDKGNKILTWVLKNVPKIVPEPRMPDLNEIAKQVQVSTFSDWKSFGIWYWNLAKNTCRPDEKIKATVAELMKDAKTKRDKVRAIYNWVITEINYQALEVAIHGWQPYDARLIFARRYGDCKDKATLLRTMLGEAGITAYPVLISMEGVRSREDLTLPMFSHFNHMICYLPPTDEWPDGWFLDGTAHYVPADFIPTGDAGATVAVIKPDGTEVKVVPPHTPKSNQTIKNFVIKINSKGGGTIDVHHLEPGENGPYWRMRLSQEDLRDERIEKTYSSRFPGVKYVKSEFSDLTDLEKTVEFRVTFKARKLVEKTAGGLTLRNVIRRLNLSRLASLAERDHDIVIDAAYTNKETVVYKLPAGFKIKSMPGDLSRKTPFGRYILKHKREGSVIKVTRIYERSVSRISKELYKEFRKFCTEVDAAEREVIILENPGGVE
ncbi:MAG: DUF3857 domain-containing protein [Planctomycetota bacterium]|nr:MAG: DUF3857 domain-containing protein [Planctomycetota bacterium]